MTTLRSKLIAHYNRKAHLAEHLAHVHNRFGPTRLGREYAESAKHWHNKAQELRNGAEFRPAAYAVA